MGCAQSKNEKQAIFSRLSHYQLASLEETRGLKISPVPLELEDDAQNTISARQFHNLFYDGFYAPYMSNPDYMLLLDTRDENSFLEHHILTAKWHGTISIEDPPVELSKFTLIVLYDCDGTGISSDDSMLKNVLRRLKQKKLDPICVAGGISAVEKLVPYMVTSNVLGVPERQLALNWYPSIIVDNALWLGRAEQGANTTILLDLNLTHLVMVGQTKPALAFPGMTCLTIPWTEALKGEDLSNAIKGAVTSMKKAVSERGRILVLGDQGVNRSATLVIAFLMDSMNCTLEDAFYYTKGLRSAIQPSASYLEILSGHETEHFGKKITATEDLW